MKNLIAKYLNSGKNFEDLNNEFGISVSEFNNLILLNYSQIDSPKTDPLVRFCRGIIVEKNSWNIVHYPFYRFYNFEEVIEEQKKFNWDNAVATQKIDGSLWGVFNYNDEWYISSRSKIGGLNKTNFCEVTFGDIFDKAISPYSRNEFFEKLDKNLDYTFELVSPYNRIVTPYEKCEIYLIGLRNKLNNFSEISLIEAEKISHISDFINSGIIKIPKIISLKDNNGKFRGFQEMKQLAELGKATDEGFVVVDWSSYDNEVEAFPRVKVKNSAYVALHHLRGTLENNSLNYANILNIIIKNEQAEVISAFPFYKNFFDEVQMKYNIWIKECNEAFENIKYFFEYSSEEKMDKNIKKEFALKMNKHFSFLFFYMYKNDLHSIHKAIEMLINENENFCKKFWENFISNVSLEK